MSKILVTGAPGYLGSHIVAKLLSRPGISKVIGTTRSLKNYPRISQFKSKFDIELLEANCLSSQTCFSDIAASHKPDYILHLACPFMEGLNLSLYSHQIRSYTESCRNLAEVAECKKLVFTGAASSVVGMLPGVYEDPLVWADLDDI